MQPSILMALRIKPTYGYELIKDIQGFGFIQGQAPPGMVYRHLRQLEEDGLVTSEWETEGGGPAKRIYSISPDGVEVLGLWIDYMSDMAGKLNRFVKTYHRHADSG